jgi:hypothetical protein
LQSRHIGRVIDRRRKTRVVDGRIGTNLDAKGDVSNRGRSGETDGVGEKVDEDLG